MLVLAGLDPSGGAGLLADAEAVRSGGARPLCVATALTVQTTRAARRFEPVSPALFADQIAALLEEEDVRAIKIGMIGSAPIGLAVSQLVARRPDLPVVLDPVMEASSGASLFAGPPAELRALLLLLLQGALVTPNLAEAVVLLGLRQEPRDAIELEAAALALRAKGARGRIGQGRPPAGRPHRRPRPRRRDRAPARSSPRPGRAGHRLPARQRARRRARAGAAGPGGGEVGPGDRPALPDRDSMLDSPLSKE